VRWINIENGKGRRFLEKGAKLHISVLEEEGDFGLPDIFIKDKLEYPVKDIIVYCGEGGYASEGFVAVESDKTKRLLWIAFFEESNPFTKVSIINDRIIAHNNLKEMWAFPLYESSTIKIKLSD